MEVWRGDIFYVSENTGAVGSEFRKERPAIVVSNDMCNKHSPVIEVVFLSSYHPHDKRLPTHVIVFVNHTSVAKCEAVYSVSKERLKGFVRHCSLSEIEDINHALRISLGL